MFEISFNYKYECVGKKNEKPVDEKVWKNSELSCYKNALFKISDKIIKKYNY